MFFEFTGSPASYEFDPTRNPSSVGKVGLPLVPSAAQMRSLRKGSNHQLAITIDSESDRLLDKGASVEDKGLVLIKLLQSFIIWQY
ncbi:hypothetical protein Tco_0964477 [Tanacetum coccineum]